MEKDNEQLGELITFLHDPKPEVRRFATNYVLSLSAEGSTAWPFFLNNATALTSDLCNLCLDLTTETAHDALKTLVNLTGSDARFRQLPAFFLQDVVSSILAKNNILADLFCMLLSNLTREKSIAEDLVEASLAVPPGEICPSSRLLDLLTEVFVKAQGYNNKAEFHFLASVFANLTLLPKGREYFLQMSALGDIPITKLMIYTEHENLIRRGGVISTIKNCCFVLDKHSLLLSEADVLPYVLLPLCGPEEFDTEDMENMPMEIQLLPPTKKRERDSALRRQLLDILVMLASSRRGRQVMRAKSVYPVIRTFHLALSDSLDEATEDLVDNLVQLLLRDEEVEGEEG